MSAVLARELRLLLVAWQFFTRVPLPPRVVAWMGFEPAWLNDCARYFPAVGLMIGGLAASVLCLGLQIYPVSVAVLLSMTATVVLTGAFHEDGLADTCDALGGAVDRARALEIMKDSRLGTYGVTGLLLVLGLKAAALVALVAQQGAASACAALLYAHAASRFGPVLLVRALRYGGDMAQAKAKPLAQQVSRTSVAVAALSVVAIGVAAASTAPQRVGPLICGTLALCLVNGWCARWFQRRLGGYTGDTLGAAQQLGELAIYLAWSAAGPWLGRGAGMAG